MPMAILFRAEHQRPRGDKSVGVTAYCTNPKLQDRRFVTLKDIEPQNQQTESLADMKDNAARATAFLKALAHEGRLMILCHLASGERSVGELEGLLQLRQAAVSQMLARLRDEGLVTTRRDGKAVFYSLQDGNTAQVIELLYDLFCNPEG